MPEVKQNDHQRQFSPSYAGQEVRSKYGEDALEYARAQKEQRKLYYRYLMQVRQAINAANVNKLREIEQAILDEPDMSLDVRLSLQNEVRDRVIHTTIRNSVDSQNIGKLYELKAFVLVADLDEKDRAKYLKQIDNAYVSISAEALEKYKNQVFFDNALTNDERKVRMDELDTFVERSKGKEKWKRRYETSERRGRYNESNWGSDKDKELPIVEDFSLNKSAIFPLDYEAIVQKFRLFNPKNIERMQEDIDAGAYAVYREQLQRVLNEARDMVKNANEIEKASIDTHAFMHREIWKLRKKYRTARRVPDANVEQAYKEAKREAAQLLMEVATNPEYDSEDRERYKQQIVEALHVGEHWNAQFDALEQKYEALRKAGGVSESVINGQAAKELEILYAQVQAEDIFGNKELTEEIFKRKKAYTEKYKSARGILSLPTFGLLPLGK